MSLTAGEQYLLELINRARLDPVAEAERYDLDLNDGLDAGTISTDAKQVLAPNDALEAAATSHSTWMLENDSFSHTGVDGSNAGMRVQSNGYDFVGDWSWRENLAWLGSTGSVDLEAAITQHHEGLYRSESHRKSTFSSDVSEIGIGQVEGDFIYNGQTYTSSMLTENFANSGDFVFVTGVAYTDADKDDFYSIGEGQSGVWVRTAGDSDTTAAAGGYAITTTAQSDLQVSVGTGQTALAILYMDTTDGNVKVDLVTQSDGSRELQLSGSTTMVEGVNDAKLLGVADLDLEGHGGANLMTGNSGDNILSGRGGADVLLGGGGNDWLIGGEGNDVLYGEDGSDQLSGNNGIDRLFGGSGSDRIMAGHGNDPVSGGGARDVIFGQGGNDRIWGNDGNDALFGNAGNDVIYGGSGGDLLDGGLGNDAMSGGAGEDLFVFSGGHDTVVDFTNNEDLLFFRTDVVGTDATAEDVLAYARIEDGDAVFDFGHGDTLTLSGISNLDILANDINII